MQRKFLQIDVFYSPLFITSCHLLLFIAKCHQDNTHKALGIKRGRKSGRCNVATNLHLFNVWVFDKGLNATIVTCLFNIGCLIIRTKEGGDATTVGTNFTQICFFLINKAMQIALSIVLTTHKIYGSIHLNSSIECIHTFFLL